MRIPGVLSLAAVAVLVASVGVARADDGSGISLDRVGGVSRGGMVSLSGTYRCVEDGTVLVGASVAQGGRQYGIDGAVAECDGNPHRWRSVGRAAVRPGRARVRVTLVKLSPAGLVPLPRFLAVADDDVRLTRQGS
ncbi:DUF6299 family protein [Streptomyces sp. RPT161]|uniref:DUF6299 family protein n=1 Tax=Streptomyces sp. RPT161 TaxID=3015993 RepID=UPI0022B8D82A|nr:DUF6299 family protein [Streptomyces sp. RPT161]